MCKKTSPADRPAAVLQIKFFREPDSERLQNIVWELITPQAPYHKRRTTCTEFLALVYDLNLNVGEALAVDYRREQNEGGQS